MNFLFHQKGSLFEDFKIPPTPSPEFQQGDNICWSLIGRIYQNGAKLSMPIPHIPQCCRALVGQQAACEEMNYTIISGVKNQEVGIS